MMFTKLAQIAAYAALVIGGLQLLQGLWIVFGIDLPYEQALARYAPYAKSPGEVIDKGIYKIIFAAALGTLAEISFCVNRLKSDQLETPDAPAKGRRSVA